MSYEEKIAALVEHVPLSCGYSAFVRALSKRDEDACQAALIGSRKSKARWEQEPGAKMGRTVVEQDLDQSVYSTEKLVRGITSWDLDGKKGDDMDDGGILRITTVNVEKLSGPDSTALLEAIDRLGAPLAPTQPTSTPSG
jgi:hypothetical protein